MVVLILNLHQQVSEKLKRLASSLKSLPTLPIVAAQLIDMIDDPRTSAKDVAALLSADQSLTARVLRLANSSFYGCPRKIGTVNLAIVMLGFDTIREIVLSTTVFSMFKGNANGQYFNRKQFWEHSIGVGVAARILGRYFRYRKAGEVFVAGLLHDIGKVILDEYLPKEFYEALRHAHRKELSLHQAEHEILGVTHGEVGGWLAHHWNLPSHITESITYHHSPAYAGKHRELVAIIHLADVLTRIRKFGNSGNNGKPLIARSAWQILKTKKPTLSQKEIRSYLMEFDREIKKGITLIEILESKM